MPTRPLLFMALTLATMAAACSSGPSTEEYLSGLASVNSTLDRELNDLEGKFNAGLLDINFESPEAEEQLIELFQTVITGTASAFSELVAGIESLEPPSELAALHEDALRAGQQVLDEYADRAEGLAAIVSITDIDSYAAAFSSTGVRERFAESCRELQRIADSKSIAANLSCP